MPANPLRPFAVAAVLALTVVACGDDDSTSTTVTTTEGPTTTVVEPTTAPPTTTGGPTTSGVPTSTTIADDPRPDDGLAGEPFELAPVAGQVLAVVGVAHDDVLNVRDGPGTAEPIVAELAPTADDAVATGRARMLTRSIWWEVRTAAGYYGWVNSRFTAITGPTFDVTSQIVADLGAIPAEETMLDLGRVVAAAYRVDPDLPTDIVMSVAPTVGDLGEVTYDVVGLGDDSVHAVRLHVFGAPTEGGEGFSLMSVESTDMCDSLRGVSSPSGLCA